MNDRGWFMKVQVTLLACAAGHGCIYRVGVGDACGSLPCTWPGAAGAQPQPAAGGLRDAVGRAPRWVRADLG